MSAAPKLSPFVRIPTPCIGVCSTALGDSVCRGCKRFNHEVINWNSFNEEQKRLIDQRLEDFLHRVSSVYLQVIDEQLLRSKVESYKIRVPAHRSAFSHAYELMRAGGEQVQPLEEFGLAAKSDYRQWTISQLRDAIDRDFWQLSSAHFERYFRA